MGPFSVVCLKGPGTHSSRVVPLQTRFCFETLGEQKLASRKHLRSAGRSVDLEGPGEMLVEVALGQQ